jgi:hypothetical protein
MTTLTTNPMRRPGPWPVIVTLGVIALIAVPLLLFAWIRTPATATAGYSQFLSDVAAGSVTRVVQTGTVLEVTSARGAYTVEVPTILTDVYGDVDAAATDGGASTPQFEARAAPDTSWFGLVLTALLPFAVVLVVFVLVLLLIVRPARTQGARSLAVRLRDLDEAHASRLIGDEEWQRQRKRILDEA